MKRILLALSISTLSFNLSANSLSDNISDEVLDSIIAAHEKFINSNILSEICRSPKLLQPNYASKELQQQITTEVHAVAKQRGIKEYDANQIRELAELEFQAFIDGSRYGVFIATKFQDTMGISDCSEKVKSTIDESQKSLLASGLYQLVARK